MALPLPRRRFTVAEYHQMAEAGILGEDDPVELLDGEIVQTPPIGDAHAGSVLRLSWLFHRYLGDVVLVSVQNPVRLDVYNEPQPDLAPLRPRADFHVSGLPGAADVSCSSRWRAPRSHSIGG